MLCIVKRFCALLLLSTLAMQAWAISIDDAKAQGLIGETTKGYLGSVVSSPSTEVRALIKTINHKRAAAYQKSAAKAGVERHIIEARIAQRLYQRAASGSYLQSSSGSWYRKP